MQISANFSKEIKIKIEHCQRHLGEFLGRNFLSI